MDENENPYRAPSRQVGARKKRAATSPRKRQRWVILVPVGCSVALFLFGWAIGEFRANRLLQTVYAEILARTSGRPIEPEAAKEELLGTGLGLMFFGFWGGALCVAIAAFDALVNFLERRFWPPHSSD
jgi:hypothetical protein